MCKKPQCCHLCAGCLCIRKRLFGVCLGNLGKPVSSATIFLMIRGYVSNVNRVVNVAILIAKGAIVSHIGHAIWSGVCVLSELSVGIIPNQDSVTHLVVMCDSFRIFRLVVVIDALLLARFDGLPICMEFHI